MKALKSPLSVHYELTEDCDNECTHCYNSFQHRDYDISKKVRERIVDEIIKSEIFHVVMTGGEPLTDKDGLFYVIERLRDENVKVSLNSNLNLMDRNTAKKLKKLEIEGILTNVIHYDSFIHDAVTNNLGSLESCLSGIKNATEEGIGVSANMVVNPERVQDVYETGKRLAEYGIKGFCATRVVPNENVDTLNPEETLLMLDQLLQFKEDYLINVSSLNPIPCCFSSDEKYSVFMDRGCSAGFIGANITQFGEMRACQHQEQTWGNIVDEGLSAVWENVPILKENISDLCKSCGDCSGGCVEIASDSDLDPLVLGNFSSSDSEGKKINSETSFRFYGDIIHRNENNGTGTLFRKPSSYVTLNEGLYGLSLVLSKSIFSVNELIKQGFPGEIQSFINLLNKRKIIMEVQNG